MSRGTCIDCAYFLYSPFPPDFFGGKYDAVTDDLKIMSNIMLLCMYGILSPVLDILVPVSPSLFVRYQVSTCTYSLSSDEAGMNGIVWLRWERLHKPLLATATATSLISSGGVTSTFSRLSSIF